MATSTLTIHQRAVRSTVLRKAVMAITGLILIGFLLMHMYGNLKMFSGPEAFNHYAHWLKSDILYPLVPQGWFIWIFRVFLLAAVVLHIWAAATLSAKTLKERGDGYKTEKRKVQTYSSRTMRWGGVLIAGFIIFHILQFTAKVIRTGFETQTEPYEMFVLSFQQIWVFAVYAILMVLICMHIRHGFWSAFATLGLNTSANARKWLNILAIAVAVLLYVGFMLPPLAVLVGWIG